MNFTQKLVTLDFEYHQKLGSKTQFPPLRTQRTQRTQRDDKHAVEIFDNSIQVWIFSCYEKGVDALKEIIVFG